MKAVFRLRHPTYFFQNSPVWSPCENKRQRCFSRRKLRQNIAQIRPMWSHQGPRSALSLSSPYPALRPFSSSYDHLGRTMTREVLSRATTNLRPQQFDTLQRRSEYCDALNVKRGARQLRLATEAKSVMLVSANRPVRTFEQSLLG